MKARDRPLGFPISWMVVVVSIFLILGVVHSLWPYDGTLIYRRAVIVSVVRPLSDGENKKHKEIITKALRLFLEKQNLEVITSPVLEGLPTGTQERTAGQMVAVNSKDLLVMARSLPADFLLVTVYGFADQKLQLVFTLLDIEEGISCATVSRTTSIDFTLDRPIGEAVDELLRSIEHKLARYSPLEPSAEVSQPADVPDSLALPLTPEAPPADPKRIEIAAAAAPFLPVGRTSDYFKIGLCTAVQASYRFGPGAVQWDGGLFAGTYMFRAEGLSGTAGTVLVPLGPLIGVVHRFASGTDLFLRLAGGAALMSVAPSGLTDRLSKLLPFALTAAGFRLDLGIKLGVVAETNLAVFFETEDGRLSPLVGFTPAVYLRLRI
jgi:hypothetical protein